MGWAGVWFGQRASKLEWSFDWIAAVLEAGKLECLCLAMFGCASQRKTSVPFKYQSDTAGLASSVGFCYRPVTIGD
jgi:hypothetical protein